MVLHNRDNSHIFIRTNVPENTGEPVHPRRSAAAGKEAGIHFRIGFHECKDTPVCPGILFSGNLGSEMKKGVGVGIVLVKILHNVVGHLHHAGSGSGIEINTCTGFATDDPVLCIEADEVTANFLE